jgi:hypothetical protein
MGSWGGLNHQSYEVTLTLTVTVTVTDNRDPPPTPTASTLSSHRANNILDLQTAVLKHIVYVKSRSANISQHYK